MRNFIDLVTNGTPTLLNEAGEKKTTTRTKSNSTFGIMPDLEAGSKAMATTATPKAAPKAAKADAKADAKAGKPKVPGKAAGGARTARSAAAGGAGMMAHPGAGEAMRSMMSHGMQDEISDEQARRNAGYDQEPDLLGHTDTTLRLGQDREPGTDLVAAHAPGTELAAIGDETVTNDNLPAIVNRWVAESGEEVLNPEWHQVKHLPGYMLNAIRAGGRQVFRQFTDTPIEDIQMICTIPGMNPERDVRGMMLWIRNHGVPVDSAEMTFGGGVKADVKLWQTEEFSFLLVHDFMGYYVYAWVGGRGVHVGHDEKKQISGY